MSTIGVEDVEAYLACAHLGDHRGATDIALGFVHVGVPVEVVLDELLAAAQRLSGERWHRAIWTAADEHLVTTTTITVVEAVAATAAPVSTCGQVVVVCAEGDWHSLPARLFTEGLRSRGWHVDFLGASTPAEHLDSFLRRRRPDALAISCALPTTYSGAARLAAVAYDHDLPVAIGGAGIGTQVQRSIALGAGIVVTGAADVDRALRDEPRLAPAPSLDLEALELEATAVGLAEAAMVDLLRTFPAMQRYDQRQRARTVEDLAFIVRFAAASLLVADPSVWSDFVAWQVPLLAARHVPEAAFLAGVEVLVELVAPMSPAAEALLRGTASRQEERGRAGGAQ